MLWRIIMDHIPIKYLHNLIVDGENEKLDFKQTVTSVHKIAKTIAAFSNHKGGTLLVGVKDNKTIAGIRYEEEKFMLDQAATFFCKPEVHIIVKEWKVYDKIVLECTIPEGKEKPYYAKDEDDKWWAYIRVADQVLLASKVMIDVLRRQSDSHGALIEYTSKEKALLDYLKVNPRITRNQLCKLLNISAWRANKMLVNLVSAGVIRVLTHEKEEYFVL